MTYVIQCLRRKHRDKGSRFYFTRWADLWNLINKFSLMSGSIRSLCDTDDITSLSMRVEDNNPVDGICLYEPPKDRSGKGFLLGKARFIAEILAFKCRCFSHYYSITTSMADVLLIARYSLG